MRLWNDFADERRAQGWANLLADLGYGSITYCPFDSLPKPPGAAIESWTVEVLDTLTQHAARRLAVAGGRTGDAKFGFFKRPAKARILAEGRGGPER